VSIWLPSPRGNEATAAGSAGGLPVVLSGGVMPTQTASLEYESAYSASVQFITAGGNGSGDVTTEALDVAGASPPSVLSGVRTRKKVVRGSESTRPDASTTEPAGRTPRGDIRGAGIELGAGGTPASEGASGECEGVPRVMAAARVAYLRRRLVRVSAVRSCRAEKAAGLWEKEGEVGGEGGRV